MGKTSKINIQIIITWCFWILAILKLIESTCLLPHGDPLYYHIAGPKMVYENGWDELHQFNAWFQTGLFDYLYFIPTFIFGPGILTHILSQTIHFLFGQFLPAFIGFRFFPLVGLLILTLNKSSDFFLYAKNDGAMAAAYFIALVYCLRVATDNSKWRSHCQTWKTGLLLGLIPAIKLSGLFFFLPLAIWQIYKNLKIGRTHFFVLLLGISIPLAPLLIRNFIFVGNPLFPGMISFFPGNLTPAIKSYYLAHMSSPLSWDILGQHFIALFAGKAILWVVVPLVLIEIIKRKSLNLWAMFPMISFALYLLVNGGVLYERYYFPAYMAFSYYLGTQLIQFKDKMPKKQAMLVVLVLLAGLADSKIDKSIKRIKDTYSLYLGHYSDPEQIVYKIIPVMQLFQNIPAGELVLSDQLSQFYYAALGVRLAQYAASPKAEFLGTCLSEEQALLDNFQYAILGEMLNNQCTSIIRDQWAMVSESQGYKLFHRAVK